MAIAIHYNIFQINAWHWPYIDTCNFLPVASVDNILSFLAQIWSLITFWATLWTSIISWAPSWLPLFARLSDYEVIVLEAHLYFSWHSFELRLFVFERGLILLFTFDPVCERPPEQSHFIRKHIFSLVRTTLNRIFLFLSITLNLSLLSRQNGNSTYCYTTQSG